MAFPQLSGLIQVGVDILNSVRDAVTKTTLLVTGDVVGEQTETDKVEHWQHVGITSRPPKPAAGKQACQGIVIRRSDHDVCIATRDLRGQALAAELDYGETCMYAPGADGDAQGRIIIKGNGNVAVYTTKGNTASGTGVTIQANADGSVHMGSEFGGISIDADGITIAHSSGAAIKLSGGNVTVIGQAVAINGGAVSLGANAVLPVLWGPTGIAGVASTSVKVAL